MPIPSQACSSLYSIKGYKELLKEGDGQKEKIDGTWDKNTMIIVHVMAYSRLMLIQ